MDEICVVLGCHVAYCNNSSQTFRENLLVPSSRVKILQGGVVPKRRYGIITICHVISQKSAYLIYVAAEAWNHTLITAVCVSQIHSAQSGCSLVISYFTVFIKYTCSQIVIYENYFYEGEILLWECSKTITTALLLLGVRTGSKVLYNTCALHSNFSAICSSIIDNWYIFSAF